MKWLKWLALAVLLLLLLLGGVAGWLLGTTSGLEFALDRASSATNGALVVERAEGDLAGPLTLHGLRYADATGLDVKVRQATLDISVWSLLQRRVRVVRLEADGIDVALPPPSPPEPEPEDKGSFSLAAPIDIVVDQLDVRNLLVHREKQSLFVADSIHFAGAWTGAGARIDELALRSPDGHVDAHGTLALGASASGDGQAEFDWTIGDKRIVGTLATHSDGRAATIDLDLNQPLAATLDARIEQHEGWPWQLDLKLPQANVAALTGDALQTLAASIHASGDQRNAELNANIDLDGWPLKLAPLQLALSDDADTLTIEQLGLSSTRVPGTLGARGTLDLAAQPLAGELTLAWQQIELPAELVGQVLHSSGTLEASGSAEHYQAQGSVKIGPPGQLANLALDVEGGQDKISIRELALQQPQGEVTAHGEVTLQPSLAWDLAIAGEQFDPGQLLAGWPGALDFDLATQGRRDKALQATLAIHQLEGELRQHAIHGEGKLHLSPAEVVSGTLDLALGEGRLHIAADEGQRNDIHVQLDMPRLAEWLPEAAGAIKADLRAQGKLAAPAIKLSLDADDLKWQDLAVTDLKLDANLPDASRPGGELDLAASGLDLAGMAFDSLNLEADGDQQNHQAALALAGPQLDLDMAVHGGMQGKVWHGQLTQLDLEPTAIPGWHLNDTVSVRAGPQGFALSRLCLNAGDPELCVQAAQDAAGKLEASYALQDLPLGLVSALVPADSMPVDIKGKLGGQGHVTRTADGVLDGELAIYSEEGLVTWLANPVAPLLGWQDLDIRADLAGDDQTIHLQSKLSDQGHLAGELAIRGPQQQLQGQLNLHLDSLAFAALLSDAVANVHGTLDAAFDIAGTVAEPALSGQAELADFSAEVPAAGLKLDGGHFTVHTSDAQNLAVNGVVSSGEGQLKLAGSVGLGTDGVTDLSVIGDQFEVADIPAAEVIASPAIAIYRDASGLRLGGRIKIDRADVDLSKLPSGSSAMQSSPDVVIMDQPHGTTAADEGLPVTAVIRVDLGDDAKLAGLGLEGRVSGALNVRQVPGREPTGQGQITINGSYHAYGQDLVIDHGQLLFASTPLDNPGLNIRAVRALNPTATIDDGQEVGLLISGTARKPVLTVFSEPVMPQADALSYLITGKPLSKVKGGEGNLVASAAQALGSAAGDRLAKGIGGKLGLDMGVSSSTALGGAAAFTVGKYLSPRLYLKYGVGLFDPGTVITLRYILSSRWNFEAIQATDFSRAAFNYRYEK